MSFLMINAICQPDLCRAKRPFAQSPSRRLTYALPMVSCVYDDIYGHNQDSFASINNFVITSADANTYLQINP